MKPIPGSRTPLFFRNAGHSAVFGVQLHVAEALEFQDVDIASDEDVDRMIIATLVTLHKSNLIGMAQGAFGLGTFDPACEGPGAVRQWFDLYIDAIFSTDSSFIAHLLRKAVCDWVSRYLTAVSGRQIEGESAAGRVARIGRAVEFAREVLSYASGEHAANHVAKVEVAA
jgi:hypothetical protein